MRVRALIALLPVAALAACSKGDSDAKQPSAPAPEKPRSGEVEIVDARRVDAPYVAGERLYGVSADERWQTLRTSINGLLIATLTPAAVPHPAGDEVVAYNSWKRTRPVVRVRDVASGKESILDEGAYSLAWRNDGALADFKADEPDLDTENIEGYVGHVVVRVSRHARPVRWTTEPGRYVVAAWAGKSLLVYRLPGTTFPDLLVLDGPGKVRVLAKKGALVAVSPDGERAFVSTYGAEPPVVRVLEVSDGMEVARFALTREATAGTPVRWVTESGSWARDLVFASSSEGIVVFRVGADEIEFEQVLKFGEFPLGAFEPQSDESGRRLVTWAQLEQRPRQAVPDAVVLECDRIALRCTQGPPVSSAIGPRLVYNPSRP